MNANYMIVASCNPYDANAHNGGGIALKTNNGTVVEWTFSNWRGLTLEEARRELAEMVAEESDDIHYEDADSIAECYDGETPEWYVGPGYYDSSNDERVFDLQNGLGYRYDTMSYSIEEFKCDNND